MWQTLPGSVPTNGATVWVRLWNYNSTPFQAVWSLSLQMFTVSGGVLRCPWYMVQKWRAV